MESLAVGFLIWGTPLHSLHPLSRMLQIRPLVWLGVLSYSLYIWHQPFAFLGPQTLGLLPLRLAATYRIGIGGLCSAPLHPFWCGAHLQTNDVEARESPRRQPRMKDAGTIRLIRFGLCLRDLSPRIGGRSVERRSRLIAECGDLEPVAEVVFPVCGNGRNLKDAIEDGAIFCGVLLRDVEA